MPGDYTASGLYGARPSPQPTPTGTPDHAPGTPEPVGRTSPRDSLKGPLGNPVFVLVALVGIAIVLTQVTVRGTLELEA